MATKAVSSRFDSAGWLFFLVALAILLAPGIWLAFESVRAETPFLAKLAVGALFAAIGSAFVTFMANSILQGISRKRRTLPRKKGKK